MNKIAAIVSLAAAFLGRHPFPGPGLAIHVPGEVTREKLDILRKADVVYLDEIEAVRPTLVPVL